RITVLRDLARRDPAQEGGMVDVNQGIIFRIGPRRRRWQSFAIILAPALLGILTLALLTLKLNNWLDTSFLLSVVPGLLDFANSLNARALGDLWLGFLVLLIGAGV